MGVKEKNKKVKDLVDQSIKNLNDLVDVNTVIGKPIITLNGFQVIPVSKVTMGYVSGGGEFGEIKVIKEDETAPFAGASGAVVSLKPAGFLLDDGSGVRYVHAGEDPLDNLIEKTTEIVRQISERE